MKKPFFIIFILFLVFIGCSIQKNNFINLDPLLKCGDYDFRDGYFTVPYNGCIYAPDGINSFGNATLYLFPAKKAERKGENISVNNTSVSNYSIDNIRENFNIICFLINKENLVEQKNREIRYIPSSNYTVRLYKAVPNSVWLLTDSFCISSEDDKAKEQEWEKKIIISNTKATVDEILTEVNNPQLPNYEYVFDSLSFDLDNDSYMDKMILSEPSEKRGQKLNHVKVTFTLMKGIGRNQYRFWSQNKNILNYIDNNCPATGYKHIIIKAPYFTIEQQNCYNFMFSEQYITFKYDSISRQVLLHKFGEQFSNRDDDNSKTTDSDEQVLTPKDFGRILFKDANIQELIQLNINKHRR